MKYPIVKDYSNEYEIAQTNESDFCVYISWDGKYTFFSNQTFICSSTESETIYLKILLYISKICSQSI